MSAAAVSLVLADFGADIFHAREPGNCPSTITISARSGDRRIASDNNEPLERRNDSVGCGLTCEDYEKLLADQAGVCAICLGVNPGGHRLAVDHDHDTGQVRGLLCHACNAGIGKLRDNPDLLREAAAYLERSITA